MCKQEISLPKPPVSDENDPRYKELRAKSDDYAVVSADDPDELPPTSSEPPRPTTPIYKTIINLN